MDLGIAGRTALVLGGTKGIGRAICRELARAGVNICVVARRQEGIDDTTQELRGMGVGAFGLSEDLLDLDSYPRIIEQCQSSFQLPDIAIFNLDPPPPGRFSDVNERLLTESFHSVVLCYARMLRVVLPHMQQQGWGRVVTVGSGTAKQLVRGGLDFGYVLANTTRVAASALAKTVAAEVAASGVTINTIGTGYIDTESARAWTRDRARDNQIDESTFTQRFVSNVPVGRKGKPEEMAGLCAYLCSTMAAYTTGETILCDGGMTNSIL